MMKSAEFSILHHSVQPQREAEYRNQEDQSKRPTLVFIATSSCCGGHRGCWASDMS